MKSEKSFPASWLPLLSLIAIPLYGGLNANELKDLVLSGGKSPSLKVVFAEGQKAEDFPLYFQKTDSINKTVTLCFLETPTDIPLGRLALPAEITGHSSVTNLSLKKVSTPSGKVFLGIEIALSELPPAELNIQPSAGASLKVKLPGKGQGKLDWSARKSLSAPPITESAEVTVAPVTEKSEPVAPPSLPATLGMLQDIQVIMGSEQQDLIVTGEGVGSGFQFKRNKRDTLTYELKLPGVKSALAAKSYSPPAVSLFAGIQIKQIKDTTVLLVRLRKAVAAQAGVAEGRMVITLPNSGGTGLKWSASAAKVMVASSMPETAPSAHDEGERIDQGKSNLTSSGVFIPTGAGKPMILLNDSVPLREKPETKAKAIKTLPAGAQLLKLEGDGFWVRMVSESDTGYLPRKMVVYSDEITAGQETKIQRIYALHQKALELAEKQEMARTQKMAIQDSVNRIKAAAKLAAEEAQPVAIPQPVTEPTVKVEPVAQRQPKADTLPVAAEEPQAELNIVKSEEQKIADISDPALKEKLEQERLAAEKDKLKAASDNQVSYNSFGRRDPFIPVEEGNSDNGIDIDQMKVVGVIWHPSDPMAVLQHVKEASVSFTVKQGDPVHNGRVSRITRDAVAFDITEYGISRSYTLKLVSLQERAKK